MIIRDGDGRFLMIERGWWPVGIDLLHRAGHLEVAEEDLLAARELYTTPPPYCMNCQMSLRTPEEVRVCRDIRHHTVM
ncbi:hypothetical protein [Marinactinospora rubrisoli]|uniref:Uncharacterized protein n=1 Tax=Marinactinospora rubrisoli TaxID=2715399 RepID=A0ABW2KN45_9ACTN